MKKKMLPYANVGEEMSNLVVNSDGHTRASHIFDTLDGEFERDNSDAENEESEDIPMPQTNFDVCEDGQHERNEKGEGKYKFLVLKEEEDRLRMARELVPEQMMVLQEVVKFCKKLTIQNSSAVRMNSELRLIVHGGAGMYSI